MVHKSVVSPVASTAFSSTQPQIPLKAHLNGTAMPSVTIPATQTLMSCALLWEKKVHAQPSFQPPDGNTRCTRQPVRRALKEQVLCDGVFHALVLVVELVVAVRKTECLGKFAVARIRPVAVPVVQAPRHLIPI